MPCRTVGVLEAAQGIGQSPVHGTTLEHGGGLVDRGPDERMPDRDAVAGDGQEPRPLCLGERFWAGTEGRGGALDRRQLAGVVGNRDQHQLLCGLGEPTAAVQEDPLDSRSEHQLGRQRRRAGQLRVTQASR